MRDTGLAALASLDVHLSIKLVPRPRKQPMVLWFYVAGEAWEGKALLELGPFRERDGIFLLVREQRRLHFFFSTNPVILNRVHRACDSVLRTRQYSTPAFTMVRNRSVMLPEFREVSKHHAPHTLTWHSLSQSSLSNPLCPFSTACLSRE